MCTSIYYETKDHTHLLARTLDFAQDMHLTPIIIENGHHFASPFSSDGFASKYRFVAPARMIPSLMASTKRGSQSPHSTSTKMPSMLRSLSVMPSISQLRRLFRGC